jgi:hypothetical protein
MRFIFASGKLWGVSGWAAPGRLNLDRNGGELGGKAPSALRPVRPLQQGIENGSFRRNPLSHGISHCVGCSPISLTIRKDSIDAPLADVIRAGCQDPPGILAEQIQPGGFTGIGALGQTLNRLRNDPPTPTARLAQLKANACESARVQFLIRQDSFEFGYTPEQYFMRLLQLS